LGAITAFTCTEPDDLGDEAILYSFTSSVSVNEILFFSGVIFVKARGATTFVRGVVAFVRGATTFVRGVVAFVRGATTFVRGVVTFVRGATTFVRGVVAFVRGVVAFVRGATTFVRGVVTFVRGDVALDKEGEAVVVIDKLEDGLFSLVVSMLNKLFVALLIAFPILIFEKVEGGVNFEICDGTSYDLLLSN